MGDVFGNENLISVLFCIVQLQNMLSSDTGYSWIPHPTCDKRGGDQSENDHHRIETDNSSCTTV